MKYRPRGTRDILPGEIRLWQFLEEKIREVSWKYGYGEIRPPIFEHTEVFTRSVGEDTDIVSKEMYTFTDPGGKHSLTLRPEGTAPVVRAYLENNLHAEPRPVKLYYYGPMFRHDRPQAGRYRQFYQYGVECFGSYHPSSDVEVIALTMDLLEKLGLQEVRLEINSVGCKECRPAYREKLQDALESWEKELCRDCRTRLHKNPLRVLDCKEDRCRELTQNAPQMVDHLCTDCREHYRGVKKLLEAQGISFNENPRLVRGLDYYTRTAFEFISAELGAQDSIGGGGRYDDLVEHMGGPSIPAVGVALGIERLLLSLTGTSQLEEERASFYVAVSGDEMLPEAFRVAEICRGAGSVAEVEITGRSLKAQMKYAGKKGFSHVLIIGEEEKAREEVTMRNMITGEQVEVPVTELNKEILAINVPGRKEEV